MDATVMPAIRATPAYVVGMGSVRPLSAELVPSRVLQGAGPKPDPDD